MHYNIAQLTKKVTNYITYFLWKVNLTLILSYLLILEWACLPVFNRTFFLAKVKALSQHKNEMNTPQAKGTVNSHLYSRSHRSNILDCMKNRTHDSFQQ